MALRNNRYIKETNKPIREELEKANMPVWKLADLLNVSEMTAFRWLRKEMPEVRQQEICRMIRKAAEQ